MKRRGWFCTASLLKIALFLFALLFLVSVVASSPVRIKRLALNSEGLGNLDYSLEEAFVCANDINEPLTSLRSSGVAPETHRFPAGRGIVSANIYRGPPLGSL